MTDPDTLAELRAIRALLERLVDRDAKPPKVVQPPPAKATPAAIAAAKAHAIRAVRRQAG